jgi:hypothetical protein
MKPKTIVTFVRDERTWRYERVMDTPGYWDRYSPYTKIPNTVSDGNFLDALMYELAHPELGTVITVTDPVEP